MVRVVRVEEKKAKKVRVELPSGSACELEYDGEELRLVKDGRVVAFCRGAFEVAEMRVESYKVVVHRRELEEMWREPEAHDRREGDIQEALQ